MLFVLVCTEGNVSEPECLQALISALKGQLPQSGDNFVDVITLPLSGNQGHTKIVERANEQVKMVESDPDSLLHYAEASDSQEKWIVCDYDELDESNITLEELKQECQASGYTLIMNKPNFEYFVLCILGGSKLADKTHHSNYAGEINRLIDGLNLANQRDKGFTPALMLPHYSKKTFIAREFFGKLIHWNPEIIMDINLDDLRGNTGYSEMPTLIDRLKQIYGINR